MMIGTVFLVFLCILLLTLYLATFYARWSYGVLEKMNIPVLKPRFWFLGSVPDLHLRVQTDEDIRRFKKFGPIWGLYEGRTPIVNICDPDLMKNIFVRDVGHFYDRRVGHFGDSRIDEILDYLPGEKWKKMRKLQTVLFSSGKIRQYSVQLGDAAKDFVDNLKAKCISTGQGNTIIDTRNAMDIVSLDGIARVSFGVKLENVEDPSNLFYRGLKRLLGEGLEYDWLYSLSMVFPALHKVSPSFQIDQVLFDTFKAIVMDRKKERMSRDVSQTDGCKYKCNDLADFLVDCYDLLETEEFKRLQISETTLLAQALNVTALDMISATMTMISYYLATHPNVQKKLHDELDAVIDGRFHSKIDNESVNELPYLTACINETLRLAPPLIRPERVCTKDWTSDDGSLKIKKGTVVMSPLWAVHRNPKYFDRPETFNPERFQSGNEASLHPYAYSPFGLGPRNCIGMRLAMETLKINVAHLLKTFKISATEATRLDFKPGMLFLLQFKPLHLKLELRA